VTATTSSPTAANGATDLSADPASHDARTTWPLRDTPEFERGDAAWRARLLPWFEDGLPRHVINAWFPRCIDAEAGGFHAEFDRRWRLGPPAQRILEFQARQTRTVARLGRAFPNEDRWSEWALHGLRFLDEKMRDHVEGGWFWIVGRDGTPGYARTKHAHGLAYALGACAQVYLLTREPRALEMANEVFDYLERNAHDPEAGGYFGWLRSDGTPIRTTADIPAAGLSEPLGTGVGLKDLNIHSDLLQALTWCYQANRDDRTWQRLVEVFDAVVEHFVSANGAMHYMTDPTWAPIPALERYGYHFQATSRLVDAAPLIRSDDSAVRDIAYRLVDHALHRAASPHGGFIEAGPGDAPDALSGISVLVRSRPWWVQGEALHTLVQFGATPDGPQLYRDRAEDLVRVIDSDLIDEQDGGWFIDANDDRRPWRRFGTERPKVDMWKDASHETDTYLAGIRILRGLPEDAPLAS
jgi:mannobiose 2-epimerase